jgi:hypothetical protein
VCEFHTPLANELSHVTLGPAELLDLLLEGAKLFLGHVEHTMARDTAVIAHLEDFREFSQREAQLQCSLHESNAFNRVLTIHAIAGYGAR